MAEGPAATRIRIDLNSCLRTGQCFYMHPKLVREAERGYPAPVDPDGVTDPAERSEAEMLLDACPAGAITLEKG